VHGVTSADRLVPGVSEFDRGTAVSARADGTTYDVELGAGWRIGSGINGGLLLAVLGSALRARLPEHPDPVAMSGYYVSASGPGPGVVSTEVLRRGRAMSTAEASLVQEQDGREVERVRALATYGDLAGLPSEVSTTATPPDLPPRERCLSTREAPPTFMKDLALLERFEMLLDPACLGWVRGEPSMRGVVQGWLRMADGREPDPILLLLAVDALPPVTFDLGLLGWTPTVELTVHVRAVPARGWLRVRHATRNLAGGLLEEDAEVWDDAGRLVAQSRQLARAPRV
jgi:hypothetical protein